MAAGGNMQAAGGGRPAALRDLLGVRIHLRQQLQALAFAGGPDEQCVILFADEVAVWRLIPREVEGTEPVVADAADTAAADWFAGWLAGWLVGCLTPLLVLLLATNCWGGQMMLLLILPPPPLLPL